MIAAIPEAPNDDWGIYLDRIGSGDWRPLAKEYKKTGLFGGVKESGKGSGAIILYYRWVLKQIFIENTLLFQNYSHIVLTRSDFYYVCPLKLNADNMWNIFIPSGEGYHGVTDRF